MIPIQNVLIDCFHIEEKVSQNSVQDTIRLFTTASVLIARTLMGFQFRTFFAPLTSISQHNLPEPRKANE
jgi:hypothetical protein